MTRGELDDEGATSAQGGRGLKKPNKLKEREETKTDRMRLNITGREKHLQAAFQSIIIPLGVEYESERKRGEGGVQFCSGYHYHHGYNHNQGNSSAGDGKADGTGWWRRIKCQTEANEGISRCNHGEMRWRRDGSE